jgi:hypothetical protein
MNNKDRSNVSASIMTIREKIAAMALQGLRAGKLLQPATSPFVGMDMWTSEKIAKQAVLDADALLAELSKQPEK